MARGAVHDKVTAATVGAAFSQIFVWAFESAAHVDAPAGVEVAFATVLVFLCGFFMPESKPPTA